MNINSDQLFVVDYNYTYDYECYYDITLYTLTIMPKLAHEFVCLVMNVDESVSFGCLDSGVI